MEQSQSEEDPFDEEEDLVQLTEPLQKPLLNKDSPDTDDVDM